MCACQGPSWNERQRDRRRQPPAPPDSLRVTARKKQAVVLGWAVSLDADSYRIYRADSVDGAWERIGSSDAAVYVDSVESARFYRVTAINLFDESDPSAIVYAADTAHADLRIAFADSFTTMNETAASCSVTVLLSKPAVYPCTLSFRPEWPLSTATTTGFPQASGPSTGPPPQAETGNRGPRR